MLVEAHGRVEDTFRIRAVDLNGEQVGGRQRERAGGTEGIEDGDPKGSAPLQGPWRGPVSSSRISVSMLTDSSIVLMVAMWAETN